MYKLFTLGLFTQEHRLEIDSRKPVFDKFNAFGQSLLDERHSNSQEIEEKIEEVQAARVELER